MKKKRETLESNINLVLSEEMTNKKAIRETEKKLLDKGIYSGFKLINKSVPIQTQPLVVVYWMARFLNEATGRNEVRPEDYFNQKEIEEFKDFSGFEDQEDESTGYVFKDFIKLTDEVYQGSLDVQDIANLWEKGVATYNKETQRDSVLVKLHSKVVEDINLNQKAVDEISDLIKKGDFFPVAPIVFNILKDGNEDYNYNIKKREINFMEGNLNCTDGFHRTMGIMAAMLDKPDIKLKFPVVVTHLTKERARKMIKQESQKNTMDKSYVKSLDSESLENYIIDEINKEGAMKQQITTNIEAIKLGKALVHRDVLDKAIQYNFNYKNKREARKVSKFLSKGLQEITDIFYEHFQDPKESKRYSAVAYSATFAGYVALLSKLYNSDNWEDELEKGLGEINFDLNDPKWEQFKITQTKVSNKTIKEISGYFKGSVKIEREEHAV